MKTIFKKKNVQFGNTICENKAPLILEYQQQPRYLAQATVLKECGRGLHKQYIYNNWPQGVWGNMKTPQNTSRPESKEMWFT